MHLRKGWEIRQIPEAMLWRIWFNEATNHPLSFSELPVVVSALFDTNRVSP